MPQVLPIRILGCWPGGSGPMAPDRTIAASRPGTGRISAMSRIFTMPVARVYWRYVRKVEKKGRSVAELNAVIEWLTGYDETALQRHLDEGTTFADFFADATLNPNASLLTEVICGVRVEDIDDPLMRQIRYRDKLVDELARGKAMDKTLRTAS
jgi:hypothetical protein